MLPFDCGAVATCVEIVSDRRPLGLPIWPFDTQIAVLARRAGARLATANTSDPEHCGVALIDPWVGVGA